MLLQCIPDASPTNGMSKHYHNPFCSSPQEKELVLKACFLALPRERDISFHVRHVINIVERINEG